MELSRSTHVYERALTPDSRTPTTACPFPQSLSLRFTRETPQQQQQSNVSPQNYQALILCWEFDAVFGCPTYSSQARNLKIILFCDSDVTFREWIALYYYYFKLMFNTCRMENSFFFSIMLFNNTNWLIQLTPSDLCSRSRAYTVTSVHMELMQ